MGTCLELGLILKLKLLPLIVCMAASYKKLSQVRFGYGYNLYGCIVVLVILQRINNWKLECMT